jgi:hypothetical protein
MDIFASTRAYEAWARRRIPLIGGDLALKHRMMAAAAFPFLRATFYRWIGVWREACPELAAAPRVLAVGDLHVENFGTWRDAEGRLVWGVNDFDEAYPLPYTQDLVRLATSALIAIRAEALAISPSRAVSAILRGYTETLRAGGHPYVLEEHHPTLRAFAYAEEREPGRFWAKLDSGKTAQAPSSVRRLLANALPAGSDLQRITHRIAGLGSLGRQRYVALADCNGSRIAREAKAVLPSACAFAAGSTASTLYGARLAARAVRSPDPFLAIGSDWVVRRLGPHCSRIELADIPMRRDEQRILRAMGRETANVHLATPEAMPAVRRDLARRGGKWLGPAARVMADAVLGDWKAWRKGA